MCRVLCWGGGPSVVFGLYSCVLLFCLWGFYLWRVFGGGSGLNGGGIGGGKGDVRACDVVGWIPGRTQFLFAFSFFATHHHITDTTNICPEKDPLGCRKKKKKKRKKRDCLMRRHFVATGQCACRLWQAHCGRCTVEDRERKREMNQRQPTRETTRGVLSWPQLAQSGPCRPLKA